MRGRKGKYYSQVDAEDQNFLEQERRLMNGGEEEDDDELGMIEEESQLSSQRLMQEDENKLLPNKSPKVTTNIEKIASPPKGVSPKSQIDNTLKDSFKQQKGTILESVEEQEDDKAALAPKQAKPVNAVKKINVL